MIIIVTKCSDKPNLLTSPHISAGKLKKTRLMSK